MSRIGLDTHISHLIQVTALLVESDRFSDALRELRDGKDRLRWERTLQDALHRFAHLHIGSFGFIERGMSLRCCGSEKVPEVFSLPQWLPPPENFLPIAPPI